MVLELFVPGAEGEEDPLHRAGGPRAPGAVNDLLKLDCRNVSALKFSGILFSLLLGISVMFKLDRYDRMCM